MKNLIATTLLLALGIRSLCAGDIVGTVKYYNKPNVPASGARVDAIREGRVIASTWADWAGRYRINNLPHSPSMYSVRATKDWFTGINPNCALFLPKKQYSNPATCNVSVKPGTLSPPLRPY